MLEYSHHQLRTLIAELQQSGKKVVFTNGVFDLLHVGHMRYLEEAAKEGDALVVGINSDASVKRIKGDKRPIVPELERAELIDGLKSVAFVTIFDTPTPVPLIEILQPDIYVKGGDYTVEKLPETPVVQMYGGSVKILSFFVGHSSTDIMKTILSRYCENGSESN